MRVIEVASLKLASRCQMFLIPSASSNQRSVSFKTRFFIFFIVSTAENPDSQR